MPRRTRDHALLPKENFNRFIAHLTALEPVHAPVPRGNNNYSFAPVRSGEEIALRYIPTILPPKKYFLPPRETLVQYRITENVSEGVLTYEKMILFGVHTCDLAGIQCLNIAFSDKPKDINYLARKNRIAIMGLECNEYCDEFASCRVMNTFFPAGGYDLFFTELETSFIIHVNTPLGGDLIEQTGDTVAAKEEDLTELERVRERKRTLFRDEVNAKHENLHRLFDDALKHPVWDDLDRRCVSCGNCTNVCPTCYCFDIRDESDLTLTSGVRKRVWDSCQNESFARVASGENFRATRADRQRHRCYRKFKYPFDKYGRYFCTGCGRCSRTCMARINLKETLNSLAGT